ncbi:MAG: pentapeptide repeat-containing protein, partial [Gaiellales bacterium]
LMSAQLSSVVFERCDMTGIDLSRVTFERCELHECTLDGARGLTTLKGVSMRWVDIVELAPLLAGAFGVHVIDEP